MPHKCAALTHGGTCIVHNDAGKVGFIRGAIPGEVVDIHVDKELSKRFFGHVTRVIEPSPHRVAVDPITVDNTDVGGRELAHIDPDFRRHLLSQVITDALSRVGGRDFADAHRDLDATVYRADAVADCPGIEDAWRHRIDVTLDKDAHAAMNKTASHDLARLTDIPFAAPAITRRAVIGSHRPLARVGQPGEKVRIVAGDNGLFAANDGHYFHWDGDQWRPTDRTHVTHQVMTDTYRVAIDGFWQAHTCAPLVLRSLVMRCVNDSAMPHDAIWELYSGAGLFSVPLARVAHSLVTWEGSVSATRDARDNLRANVGDCDHVTMHRPGPITARTVTRLQAHHGSADVIVLDPPRAGAGVAVMDALAQAQPRTVIYVGCDIASWIRDSARLCKHGYAITQCVCIDLFPQTRHCECVVTMERL